MAESILGLDFDIHGGGLDLVFPHHENEIAQTEAARGSPLARHWVHNGMIQFGEEKMAKSVGNIRLLSDALDEVGRDVIIMYLIGGHYRQSLAFTPRSLEQAGRSLERIVNFGRLLDFAPSELKEEDGGPDPRVVEQREAFFAALAEDFNTPQALAALFDLVAEGNRRLEAGVPFAGVREALGEMLGVFGLASVLEDEKPVDPEAERLAAEREEARRAGDFERADALRKELGERGFEVRDTADGPVLVSRDATPSG
jgi:cysteinyl-tRNA synthetase